MKCDKCGYDQPDEALSCNLCGAVFRKEATPGYPAPTEQPVFIEEEVLAPSGLDREGLISTAIAVGITGLIFLWPFLSYIFSYLGVIIHEGGHALFGWLLGYPSIPSIDLNFGGGVTLWWSKSYFLVGIVFFLLAAAAGWAYWRGRVLIFFIIVAIAGVYSFFALTGYGECLILLMGHGTEIFVGAVFLYFCLSGSPPVVSYDRALYGASGLFLLTNNFVFAMRLATDVNYLADYGEAKGGGNWMDFDRIGRDYLHVTTPHFALAFAFLCFGALVAGLLLWRYAAYWRDWLRRLFA
ncbi:MAG: hypothetical protein WC712_12260 [Candidatus Brocadiia bacterium]